MPNIPIKFKPDGVEKTTRAFGKVQGSASKLAKILGPAILGAAVLKLGKSAITTAGEFEALKTRLLAMTGSMKKANSMFKQFNDIAATTPFAVKNVVEAGVSLKAFGLDAEKTIKPVADLAAFMGTDVADAAAAVGRAFAGGAGAADILRERGILQLIKDSEGIEDLSKLTLPEFRKALISAMTDEDGMIAGSTDLLAKTWQGKLSNMQDAWSRLMAAVGDEMLPFAKDLADKITLALGDGISFVKSVDWSKTLNMENLGLILGQITEVSLKVFGVLVDSIDTKFLGMFGKIGAGFMNFFSDAFNGVIARLKAFNIVFGQAIVIEFKTIGVKIQNFFIDKFNFIIKKFNDLIADSPKLSEFFGLEKVNLFENVDLGESLEPFYENIRQANDELQSVINPPTDNTEGAWEQISTIINDSLDNIKENIISYKEETGVDEEGNSDPLGDSKVEDRLEKKQSFMEQHQALKKNMTEEDKKMFEDGKKRAAQAAAAAAAGAAQLAQVKAAATGFSGQLNKPTMFLAGEKGAEQIDITPLNAPNVRGPQNQGMEQPVNISFEGNVMDENYITEQAIPMIRDAVRRGEVLSD